jgi:hypothetical protein
MAIHICLVTYIYISCDAYVYVRPKLKVIGQMSCQVKYLFAALWVHPGNLETRPNYKMLAKTLAVL